MIKLILLFCLLSLSLINCETEENPAEVEDVPPNEQPLVIDPDVAEELRREHELEQKAHAHGPPKTETEMKKREIKPVTEVLYVP